MQIFIYWKSWQKAAQYLKGQWFSALLRPLILWGSEVSFVNAWSYLLFRERCVRWFTVGLRKGKEEASFLLKLSQAGCGGGSAVQAGEWKEHCWSPEEHSVIQSPLWKEDKAPLPLSLIVQDHPGSHPSCSILNTARTMPALGPLWIGRSLFQSY